MASSNYFLEYVLGNKTRFEGKKVLFISDDPASPIDFTHFSENEGYEISIKSTTKGVHYFTMYKLKI